MITDRIGLHSVLLPLLNNITSENPHKMRDEKYVNVKRYLQNLKVSKIVKYFVRNYFNQVILKISDEKKYLMVELLICLNFKMLVVKLLRILNVTLPKVKNTDVLYTYFA